jgi:multidrug transporter EmrE-like cation transporter
MNKISFFLLAASAVTNAMGSTIMKHAYGGGALSSASGFIGMVLKILLNPWTIAGLGCFGISFFFMAAALSRTDLTLAYPLMSGMVYLILLFVGAFIFHEKITLMRVGGMACILAGIAMLTAKL